LISRGPCTFRESDLRRAVRAVEAAGKEVAAIEIGGDGKIRIVVCKPGEQELAARNEWDEDLCDGNDQAAVR
jgi:hypothetical protein